MIDFIGKGIVLDAIQSAITEFTKAFAKKVLSSKENKIKLSIAITSVKQAIIETNCYIKTKGYKPNVELSRLWLAAMNSCVEAGITGSLPDYLYHKADFWGDPQEWLNHPQSMELIPKLKKLKDECDSLMVKLNEK